MLNYLTHLFSNFDKTNTDVAAKHIRRFKWQSFKQKDWRCSTTRAAYNIQFVLLKSLARKLFMPSAQDLLFSQLSLCTTAAVWSAHLLISSHMPSRVFQHCAQKTLAGINCKHLLHRHANSWSAYCWHIPKENCSCFELSKGNWSDFWIAIKSAQFLPPVL